MLKLLCKTSSLQFATVFLLFVSSVGSSTTVFGQEGKVLIPRKQSKPPGPPLSPEEALAKMTVPQGFHVELVAAEPDLLNPVAMAFDERGRIWVTESFEYPRHDPGPGRDRIKILEDTDSDGRVDSVKVFAEGLNIPSGIAVGHGGVWVANAPDILFLKDTDGDDKADTTEVVVTGFGRFDTHELPNSLTWGPDGALYGLNGVFNACRVEAQGKTHEFTCAMFRIDPRTHEFSLFCEGTSNPWGIAFDPNGHAFISACVIDHLWHLTETGYYHRQGGPYPPNTWKIDSIVKHKHQMAAYCGITYFDSASYPAEYRDKLMMGNIHGNCINVDRLERQGSTYAGFGEEDFLSGNDVWFMPVVQKVGPDGCLYVLDWYDRYHCYQDASADPEGVDRGHGRLYRVVHSQTGRPASVSLANATNEELVDYLANPNVYLRETAQRMLAERNCQGVVEQLQSVVLNTDAHHKNRMHALWALTGGQSLSANFVSQLLQQPDDMLRAWGVRVAGSQFVKQPLVVSACMDLLQDESPDVQLQLAIAIGKFPLKDRIGSWVALLGNCGQDPLIPHIVWQNMHPQLGPAEADRLLVLAESVDLSNAPGFAAVLTKVAEKLQE
ncbi:MAG: hypothetical protein KDB22_26055 [Planctomycetales bacterium]|nr:hypothetical protein [Planctomycetales bacterium]